jgi:hypothetical protein
MIFLDLLALKSPVYKLVRDPFKVLPINTGRNGFVKSSPENQRGIREAQARLQAENLGGPRHRAVPRGLEVSEQQPQPAGQSLRAEFDIARSVPVRNTDQGSILQNSISA